MVYCKQVYCVSARLSAQLARFGNNENDLSRTLCARYAGSTAYKQCVFLKVGCAFQGAVSFSGPARPELQRVHL